MAQSFGRGDAVVWNAMRNQFDINVILVNLACSHCASSLLIYLYAVPSEGGVALSGRYEAAEFFSIAAATGIGSVQYGFLLGFAFSGSYVLLGAGVSGLAPRRRILLVIGSLLSCAATVMMGLAGSFWELFSARATLGLGEWFVNNASHALIVEKCPSDARGEANGIYVLGVYLGMGVASLSLAGAQLVGWRSVCHVVALCRLIAALVALCAVTERPAAERPYRDQFEAHHAGKPHLPRPGSGESVVARGRCEVVGTVLRSKLLIFLIAASSVRSMGYAVLTAFLPQFYAVCHRDALATFSVVNAVAVAVGANVSSSAGLRIVDYWVRSGNGRSRVYVPAIGALLSIPFAIVVLFYASSALSMVALVGQILLSECWLSPAISVLQLSLPPRLRGYSIAVIMVTTQLAASVTLFLFGKLDEHMATSGHDADITIRFELILATFATHLMSALLFYAASRCVHAQQADDSPVLYYEKQAFDNAEAFPFVSKSPGGPSFQHRHEQSEEGQFY